MPQQKLITNLQKVLADTYALYIKTHNYHWNVTGPYFQSLHALFEGEYLDLADAIDDIAERIRALGAKVPANFSNFSKLTTIKEPDENLGAMDMVQDLVDSHDEVIKSLHSAMEPAHSLKDEATLGILVERLTVHEKTRWMLHSTKE